MIAKDFFKMLSIIQVINEYAEKYIEREVLRKENPNIELDIEGELVKKLNDIYGVRDNLLKDIESTSILNLLMEKANKQYEEANKHFEEIKKIYPFVDINLQECFKRRINEIRKVIDF